MMELLITVKAYPEISKKLGEVVCVAGIRTDVQPYKWVRLWPIIDFRDLPPASSFKKYQFVEVAVSKSVKDSRPESHAPDPDTLRTGATLASDRGWAARRPYVEAVVTNSMCEIQQRQAVDGTSLGAFRPAEVLDLEISEADEWTQAQRNSLNQLNLLADDREQLEWIPYRFRYVYRCAFEHCSGHRQTIIDWEIKQAYRRWSREYPDDWAERIRNRWLDELCSPDRDTVFFVGNQFGAPKAFLVLGVYWPPKQPSEQLGLLQV